MCRRMRIIDQNRSYARNVCILASTKTICNDATRTAGMSEGTFLDYLKALKKPFIIEDVQA